MIQGLLAGVVEERKLSIQSGGLLSDAHAPFLSTTAAAVDIASTFHSSASSVASPLQMVANASSPSTASEGPQQNLRCPRCDSSNTKFCYYNNYNLTQPRHFCKTCRRYWTKGGALRNVPIGGGCRKAKPAPAISAAAVKSAAAGGKPTKPVFTMDRAGLGVEPARFPPATSTSHLLALLRAGGGGGVLQYPNHNSLPALNGIRIKEEGMMGEPAAGGLALPALSLDPFGMGSLWRNDSQFQYPQPQQSNAAFGDVAAGIQELYHRLRSPATSAATSTAYCSDQSSVRNGWSTPATSSLEPTAAMATAAVGGLDPVLGGELGFWNAGLMSWSDMSTSN